MSQELFRHLRRAKLDTLLFFIANAIRGMFERNEPIMNVPVVRFDGPVHQEGNVTVTAWNLSDLAYLAIKESNDFQAWESSVHDLAGFCNFFLAWDEDRSRIEFDGLADDEIILKFAVGFTQKQFWYQEIHRIREEFNRQVKFLEVIPSEIGSQVDLEGVCKEVTGFDLKTFRTILFALISSLPYYSVPQLTVLIDPIVSIRMQKKVLEGFGKIVHNKECTMRYLPALR